MNRPPVKNTPNADGRCRRGGDGVERAKHLQQHLVRKRAKHSEGDVSQRRRLGEQAAAERTHALRVRLDYHGLVGREGAPVHLGLRDVREEADLQGMIGGVRPRDDGKG